MRVYKYILVSGNKQHECTSKYDAIRMASELIELNQRVFLKKQLIKPNEEQQ